MITVDVGGYTRLWGQMPAPRDPEEQTGSYTESSVSAGIQHPVPGDCPDVYSNLHWYRQSASAIQVLLKVSQG